MKPESDNEFYKKEAKDMVNVIQRLLMEGKRVRTIINACQNRLVRTRFFYCAQQVCWTCRNLPELQ